MKTKISTTARFCAFARAYHSNFTKDKVFDDFLAYDLMGKEEYDMVYGDVVKSPIFNGKEPLPENMADAVRRFLAPIPLSRVQFAERKLGEFAEENPSCQYVILGAGYDTFAFRNERQNLEIFEIDHPSMQAFKKQRIRDLEWNIPQNVHFVPVDFEKDDMVSALLEAGFDPGKKTYFSILGVAYYLRLPVFEKTIAYISALSKPGSMVVFDYPSTEIHGNNLQDRSVQLARLTASLGEPMEGGYHQKDVAETLARHHFQIRSQLSPSAIQKQFFDSLKEYYRAFENIYFISAVKMTPMKKIASFTVNHDTLERGMYISRIDGDIVTYDIRMKRPNGGDYLTNGQMHTFEHLFATFARNTAAAEQVIYVGPMGCRTGFYFLVRDNLSHTAALNLFQEALAFIGSFKGEIPGARKWECGNYLEHDLDGAKAAARDMTEVLKDWNREKMNYQEAEI